LRSSPASAAAGPRRGLLALLLAHSVLTQVVTYVVRPSVTYRALELHVPSGWLGALAASFAVVPLLLAVPSGTATDRFGERTVMLAGALLITASGALLLVAGHSPAGLILGIAVLGTGQLLSVVGEQAAVANSATDGAFDAAFGYYTFAASLGQAIGPGLIIVLGGRATIPDTRALFVAAVGMGLVLLLCSVGIHMPARSPSMSSGHAGSFRALVGLPGLLRALLVSCVVLAALDITLVYLPALGADRGLAAGFVGLLLTLRALASMTTRLFLGRLVTALGRRRLMIIAVALAAVATGIAGLPLPRIVLAVVVVLMGLGLGVGQPLTMAWLATSAPPGLRGRAMSLRLTGNRLGQVIIPSVVGAVAASLGATGVLWATAAALGLVATAARRLTVDRGSTTTS
jgi:MFS family permease